MDDTPLIQLLENNNNYEMRMDNTPLIQLIEENNKYSNEEYRKYK